MGALLSERVNTEGRTLPPFSYPLLLFLIPFPLYNMPFFVGRVEARHPTCVDCGYHVGCRASTRPTEEWYKNN